MGWFFFEVGFVVVVLDYEVFDYVMEDCVVVLVGFYVIEEVGDGFWCFFWIEFDVDVVL